MGFGLMVSKCERCGKRVLVAQDANGRPRQGAFCSRKYCQGLS